MTNDPTNHDRPGDRPASPANQLDTTTRFELAAASPVPLNHPWLVAAWPGMGGVAAIAATHLVSALDAKPMGLIPEQDFFPVNHVEVHAGIARSGRLPRSMFFAWRDPAGRRDLIIFVGEAQPTVNGPELCRRVLDVAQLHGVERVVTFAAMASALHPTAAPRVFGAVTAPELLESMRQQGVELLREGQIGGLNGALLAAAAARNTPGICLLGEMPFFAAGAPNPKASIAALSAFGRLAGVEIDLTALEEQARLMEPHLAQLFEQLQRQQGLVPGGSQVEDDEPSDGDDAQLDHDGPDAPHRDALDRGEDPAPNGPAGSGPDEDLGDDAEALASPGAPSGPSGPPAAPDAANRARREPPGRELDAAARRRLEELFANAAANRDAAIVLKTELDRLGVFSQYEDRFLDLFRKAE